MKLLRIVRPFPSTAAVEIAGRQVLRVSRGKVSTIRGPITLLRSHRDGRVVMLEEAQDKPWLKLVTISGIFLNTALVSITVQWRWGRKR